MRWRYYLATLTDTNILKFSFTLYFILFYKLVFIRHKDNKLTIYYQRKSYLGLTSFVRTGEWRLLYKHVIVQLGISRGDF